MPHKPVTAFGHRYVVHFGRGGQQRARDAPAVCASGKNRLRGSNRIMTSGRVNISRPRLVTEPSIA
jgi:hypothetical protein